MAQLDDITGKNNCEYGTKAIKKIEDTQNDSNNPNNKFYKEDPDIIAFLDRIRLATANKYYNQKSDRKLHEDAVEIHKKRIEAF
jgi:hypothetical protein